MGSKFNIYLFYLFLLMFGISCTKVDVPDDTPRCIKKEIKSILKEPKRNPPAEVWKYKYKGSTVYFIPAYCCDAMSVLYDESCNEICKPDGGFNGSGDGKCPDFFTERTEGELIWTDTRE